MTSEGGTAGQIHLLVVSLEDKLGFEKKIFVFDDFLFNLFVGILVRGILPSCFDLVKIEELRKSILN